jgi:hypothetical protein
MHNAISKLNFISDPSIQPRWAVFAYLVECPECGDQTGHAGLFAQRSSSGSIIRNKEGNPKPSAHAYCVKCDETYQIKGGPRAVEKLAEGKPVHQIEAKVFTSFTGKLNGRGKSSRKINFSSLSEDYAFIRQFMRKNIPDHDMLTRGRLQERGYPEDYIDYLMHQGYASYQRIPDKKLRILESTGYNPCYRTVPLKGTLEKVYEFYQASGEGLLIPLRHGRYTIGMQVRNIDPEAAKYKLLCIPSLYLSRAQREERFMSFYSYMDSEITDAERRDPRAPLYITEGIPKADAIHYYLKKRVIGVAGTSNFTSDDVQKVLLENHLRPIVVVPDRDYRTNPSVAMAVWKLVQWLSDHQFDVQILEWGHPDKEKLQELKGIDDAILQARTDSTVSFHYISSEQLYLKLHKKVRFKLNQRLAKTTLKPGTVISSEVLDRCKGRIIRDDSQIFAKPDETFDSYDRVPVWNEALAKHKLVVDISATGSGKSHAVGLLEIEELNNHFFNHRVLAHPEYAVEKHIQDMLPLEGLEEPKKQKKVVNEEEFNAYQKMVSQNTVKRVFHVSQSPINNTVETIADKYTHKMGRNSTGWVHDAYLDKMRPAKPGEQASVPANCPQATNINALRQKGQLKRIKAEVCAVCPLKEGCDYLGHIRKVSKKRYQMCSLQSLSVKEGDLVILDDFGSVPVFQDIRINTADVTLLIHRMKHLKEWKPLANEAQALIFEVLDQVKHGMRGRKLYDEMLRRGRIHPDKIGTWLSLEEPDKLNTRQIKWYSSGNVEFLGKAKDYKDMKRWFFSFLEVLTSDSVGDIFFDSTNGEWVVKGIDPKFKEMLEKAAAIMILDATANKEYLEMVFGESPYVISAAGDPLENITIKQVEGIPNTHKTNMLMPKSIDNTIMKIDWINEDINKRKRNGGIITFKTLLDDPQTRDLWSNSLTKGYWFFSERASNLFYLAGVNTLYLMGVPIPNLDSTSVETDGDGELTSALVARPYGPVKEDGTRDYIITKDVENEKLRHLLWYKKGSAYIQAAGRLRSLRRTDEQLELVIIDKAPLPFVVDEIIQIGEYERVGREAMVNDEVFRKQSFVDNVINVLEQAQKKYGDPITFAHTGFAESKGVSLQTLANFNLKTSECTHVSKIISLLKKYRADIEKKGATLIPDNFLLIEDEPLEETSNIIPFPLRLELLKAGVSGVG